MPDFLSQLNTTLDRYAHLAEQDFNATESSWQNHRIAFAIESYTYGRRVFTDSDIYYWLNFGTSVRHAGLSSDWISKTKVRSLGSGAGAGRVIFVSSNFKGRGIDARHFDEVVQEKHMADFIAEMQKLAEDSVVL